MTSPEATVWVPVNPQGLARTVLITTIVFTCLCIPVVLLRIWVRVKNKIMGLEDYLMCVGVTVNMIHNGVVIWSTLTGIGTRDAELSLPQMMQAAKSILFWQCSYVTGSLLIKSSICMQLSRIATRRLHKAMLYVLIAISALTTAIAVIAVLIRCKPVAASWNPSLGTCIDQQIIIVLTYVVSVCNIITDWTVAIIPIFILWNVQMPLKLKRLVGVVMGVGILASVATIIRMPYSSAYSEPVDQLYHVGNIILWTVVECGLGIIAGCMPMLRTLFKSLSASYGSGSHPQDNSNDVNLVTIGKIKGRHGPIYETDLAVTVVAGDDQDSVKDDESTKNIIRVSRRVEHSTTSHPYKQLTT